LRGLKARQENYVKVLDLKSSGLVMQLFDQVLHSAPDAVGGFPEAALLS
jgi:hypothetical protein